MASVIKRRWSKPNGSIGEGWQVRYVDPSTGKRPSKTFVLKKDAEAFKRKVEREIEDGVHVAKRHRVTVRQAAAEYMAQAKERLADGRIGKSRYLTLEFTTRLSIVKHLGDCVFADLRSADVERFYIAMQKNDGLSVRTARDRIYDFQLIERFSKKRGYLKSEPVTEALIELRGTAQSVVSTFTKDEVTTLLKSVRIRGFNMKERSARFMECAINLAALCGLRLGEIMALTQSSLDFVRCEISVTQSLTFEDILKGPKTRAGVRPIPLPSSVALLLKEWIDHHAVVDKRGLIFRTPKGTMISGANFHIQWRKSLRNAKLLNLSDPFHFHALRHFCASWLIENNWPLTDVAALLGHSKFDMTLQTYAHVVTKSSARLDLMERTTMQLLAA